jgi:ribosomal protein S18 acetylase RimI-like enzyme
MHATPDDEIVIRPITPADIPGCRHAVDSVARERLWLAAVEGFSIQATEIFVHHNLIVSNPHFVACHGDDVIGWCDIVELNLNPGFEHNGRLGMGVLAPWRGRGVGGHLLSAALAAVPARGFTRIELEVYASNAAALALYRRHGFIEEGRKVGVRQLDGRTDDLILMARRS